MAADKQAAPQSEAAAPAADAKPKGRKKTFLVVGLLMILEGVGVFFAAKMFGGAAPVAADAAESAEGTHEAAESGDHGGGHGGDSAKNAPFAAEFGEVLMAECRPTNRVSGRLVTFRMRVSILVKASSLEKAKGLVEANKARIEDRINFVIRSADPTFLYEPTLDTIKRRLKSEFDRLLCDDQLIEEILIPEMLASAPGL